MKAYFIIKVPFLHNADIELEQHLNASDVQGCELVEVIPTRFEEVWLVLRKKPKPWWMFWKK